MNHSSTCHCTGGQELPVGAHPPLPGARARPLLYPSMVFWLPRDDDLKSDSSTWQCSTIVLQLQGFIVLCGDGDGTRSVHTQGKR